VEARRRDDDPINIFRDFMKEQEWLSEADDEQIQQSAADEMARAVKFAEDSPWPESDQVGTDVLLDTREVA
jgi:TPP-dependent pyruvate/acetoin dehydrogenase alpha subunit